MEDDSNVEKEGKEVHVTAKKDLTAEIDAAQTEERARAHARTQASEGEKTVVQKSSDVMYYFMSREAQVQKLQDRNAHTVVGALNKMSRELFGGVPTGLTTTTRRNKEERGKATPRALGVVAVEGVHWDSDAGKSLSKEVGANNLFAMASSVSDVQSYMAFE